MKIISIVGPKQTGSTMLFNMIRLCLLNVGFKVDSCFVTNYEANDYNASVDYLIVKCHEFSEILFKNSFIIFLPIRDVRDCAVSWQKRFFKEIPTTEQYINYAIDNIKIFDDWRRVVGFVVKYEDYVSNKYHFIRRIITKLNIQDKTIDIDKIFHELDLIHNGVNCPDTDCLDDEGHRNLQFNNKIYRSTLMTKSHNTSGGRIGKYSTCIPKDILLSMNRHPIIAKHLTSNGYRVSCVPVRAKA